MIIYIGNYLTTHQQNPNFNQFLAKKFEEMGYEVVRVSDKKNKFLRLLDMLYTIVTYRKKATYIYIDTFSSAAFWFAYFSGRLAFFFRIPYFTIVRGGDMLTRIKKSPVYTHWLFNHSKHNISPSHFLEKGLEEQGIKVIYIPNFLDIEQYIYKERKDIKPNILWVRSLHAIYQPLMACEVVNRLKDRYPQIKLTMVGPEKDGSKYQIEKYIQENQLENNIVLTGKLEKKDWHQLAASHDIFLNTTSIDNHPVSVIEAMALGLPIVSTNAGGLRFLLTHNTNSLLVDIDDLESMCTQIESLLNDPILAYNISNKAKQLADTFDWKYIKPKYEELMKEGGIKLL
jgi:glycosyltransferase involved in cell wall biosynthesis